MKHQGTETFAIHRMAWTLARFPVEGRTPMRAAKLACAVLQLGEAERQAHLAAQPYPDRLQVAKALATESFEWMKTSWQVAEVAARAALTAVETPGPPKYDALRADLQAEATAALANALRVSGDLFGAQKLWPMVRQHQARGTGAELLDAHLAYVESALFRALRQFPKAITLLDDAVSTFLEVGAIERAARAQILLATVHFHAGNPEAAHGVLCHARPLVCEVDDPRLDLDWRHNFLLCLNELGKPLLALSLYDDALPLYELYGSPSLRLLADWFVGRVGLRLGKPEIAARQLSRVREQYLERGMSYDAALVSLDEALALLEARQNLECADLARAMVGVFEALHIDREASAALLLFVHAATELRATTELVHEAKRQLEASGRTVSRGED
jgi:tetratricopeptide (TPR) repeat protein